MRRILFTLIAVATLAPVAASAGFVLGAGTGLAKPMGSMGNDVDMSDAASIMFPVELQLGWKFADQLTVAGFFAMDLGIPGGDFKDACDATDSVCFVNQARVGLQGRWNFMPARRLDPWVGLGLAWETLAIENDAVTTNMKGLAVDAMAGVDYWLTPKFAVSPWLGLSVGKYTDWKVVNAMDEDWQEIEDQKVHTMVTAGVRVAWDFGGKARETGAPAAP